MSLISPLSSTMMRSLFPSYLSRRFCLYNIHRQSRSFSSKTPSSDTRSRSPSRDSLLPPQESTANTSPFPYNSRFFGSSNESLRMPKPVPDSLLESVNAIDLTNHQTLQDIQSRIETLESQKPKIQFKMKVQNPSNASVLIPLCMVQGKASILFTVRSTSLRQHKGEVAFPGGNQDPEDVSLLHTALRETYEEIGIPSCRIRLLGSMSPIPNHERKKLVTPYVGYLGELPSNLEEILVLNPDEVQRAFVVSIRDLMDPTKQHLQTFRGSSEIVVPAWPIGSDVIWGLTAYFLNQFLVHIIRPMSHPDVSSKL